MIGMDALSRKTTFGNRTRRQISVQPLRCSVELQIEIEGQETIIPAGGIWRVKANEFCCEEIIPDLLGVLRIKFVGEEEPAATITAHHVRNCAYIFFNEDADHAFTVTGIRGTLWDHIPLSWMLRNYHGRNEVLIYSRPQRRRTNFDAIAGPGMVERSNT